MILTLVFIGVFVIALVLFILTFILDWDEDVFGGIFGTIGAFALLGTIICGIWTITVNTSFYAKTEEYEIKETIKLYQNEKSILESYHVITEGNKTEFTSDITFETVSTNHYYEMVGNYNTKIFKFKTEAMGHKYRRKNPWLNWFESSAWDTITEELLENLTYTIGK